MEQQCSTGLAEGEIAEFIQNDHIHAQQGQRQSASLAVTFLPFQHIDQVDRGVKAYSLALGSNASNGNRGGQVGLACAWAANEYSVLRRVRERHGGQLSYQCLVDLGRIEIEASQVAVQRELGRKHLVTDRAHGPVGLFGLQQVLDQPARCS